MNMQLLKKSQQDGAYRLVEFIPGAMKFGRDWAIPRDTPKPKDHRITTGEYKNWRKKEDAE